jgi:hypothetical protein
MAMARAAAGMHMAQCAIGSPSAENEHTAQEYAVLEAGMPQLLRSQAKGLVEGSTGERP